MREFLERSVLTGLGLMVALSAAAVACGGGSAEKKTEPTTAATQPAATTSATTPVTTSGGGQGTVLTLVGKNTLFDKSELKAKAGEVTIELDNQDEGIPHNVHLYKGKDNTGDDLGKTELEAGPTKQTMKVTLAKGDYFFVCDVHPATMSGKLEVE